MRLVPPFQTTAKLVSPKWTNSPFFQWLKHVHFPSGTFPFTLTVVSCHAITGAYVAPSTNISPRSLPYLARERATHARGAFYTGTHVVPSTSKANGASRTRKGVRTCAEIAFLRLFLSLARLLT
ncbi:MAG: hypothetical protein A4E62_01144 [Syntrophorhabdus sp. PtaU1.Bin002]|nr:MAG: hypothetical protein A4E62_01144 [Syntrophorhabdus sp. PtaU1.Bin002]